MNIKELAELLSPNEERDAFRIENTGKNAAKIIYSEIPGAGGQPQYSNLPAGGTISLDGSYTGQIMASSKLGTSLEIVNENGRTN